MAFFIKFAIVMDICRIAICFDDGRKDLKDVALPISRKYGLKCTCYITTGYIDGSAGKCPSVLPALSIRDVQELYQGKGIEIGCHGDLHRNDLGDILAGLDKLSEWLGLHPKETGIGFASPGTDFIKDSQTVEQLQYAGIHYIRLSLCIKTWAFIRNLARKVCRFIPVPFLYRYAYAESYFEKTDFPYISSVPVYRTDNANMLKSLLKVSIQKKREVIFMFHSVLEQMPGDIPAVEKSWIYPEKDFEKFCRELAYQRELGKCQVVTVEEIYRLS